ncbi:contractile injection system tape measure protein [Hymenobacter negativus]|uniref:Uncharacterized protein n=1 Tax=Hymenobacter negativus TaxID=2795026 RepID=A0ABS3QJW3_9BACT|nr:contractile injection system tape measure protein [Hymenobacter negativus]MBO2011555.1 hypothetical protein [Hymenobacter negativus]
MTHHIRQYHLHLDLNGTEADGLALQSQLAGLCSDSLLPVLERVFDRYAPPGVHLVLDRLEIEAGTLSLEHLEHDGPAAVAQAIEKVLREQAAQLRAMPGLVTENVGLKTGPQNVEEAFFHFLSTGRLPWAFRLPEGRRLEQAVLGAWAAMAGSGAIPGRVRELLRRALGAANVRQRLVWQFSAAFRERLLATFWPESQRVMVAIRTVLGGAGQAATPALSQALTRFETVLWEVVLGHLVGHDTRNAAEIVAEAWLRLPAPIRQPAALQAVLERHWPGSTKGPATSNLEGEKHPTTTDAKLKNRLLEQLEPAAENEIEGEEGYYLDNAGLVLLHPFLPRFFEGLGLTENDQLLHPERALCLLHFLATGQPSAPEHALTLPKLLCAIPLARPVATDLTLTTAQTDEAEALLRAVVHHWSALRSTSPDALRGTFLARAGKLSRHPDNSGDWLLQVEPMSYDILLDQLPWGISMIQLPWMPQMLRVEWG